MRTRATPVRHAPDTLLPRSAALLYRKAWQVRTPSRAHGGAVLAQAASSTMTGTRCARLPAHTLTRAQPPMQGSVPGRSCPLRHELHQAHAGGPNAPGSLERLCCGMKRSMTSACPKCSP